MLFDHTSVLKFIEWRWSLNTLSPRDAGTDLNNLAYALDFTKSVTALPSLPTPAAPAIGAPCPANPSGAFGLVRTTEAAPRTANAAAADDNEWGALRELAIQYGFKVA
jgi:phospholipase C